MAALTPHLSDADRLKMLVRSSPDSLRWNGTEITYAFPLTVAGMNNPDGELFLPVQAGDQAALIRLALTTWDDLIAPRFVQASSNAASYGATNLEFGFFAASQQTNWLGAAGGIAYVPNPVGRPNGTVWLSSLFQLVAENLDAATHLSDSYLTARTMKSAVHEIGHALGLNHAGNYNGSLTPSQVKYREDSMLYTVMSYVGPDNDFAEGAADGADWTSASGEKINPQTPMMLDIKAIQLIYGASTTTRLGDTVYGFNTRFNSATEVDYDRLYNFTINHNPVLTLYDNGGNDTLDLSGFTAPSTIDLQDGHSSDANWMTKNLWIAEGTIIENAVGGPANDSLTGNAANNWLRGGGGNDKLYGLAGDDLLDAGTGNDELDGGTGTDTAVFSFARVDYRVSLNTATGLVTLESTRDGSVDKASNIEWFQFGDTGIRYTMQQVVSGDLTAPTVALFSPAAGSSGVALGANIVVVFSEPVLIGQGYVRVLTGSTVAKAISVNDATQVTLNGNTLTINPNADLLATTQFKVEFEPGIVRDASGNAFAGLTGAAALGFTTGAAADVLAPSLVSFAPADGASALPVSTDFVLNFSEPVVRGNGTISIYLASGQLARTIPSTDLAQVSITGSTVTLNPATDLTPGTDYYLNISAGAFKDAAGNAYAGLDGNTGYNFSTARAADDFADNAGTTGTVVLGGTRREGKIEAAGDLDYFKVELSAGTSYTFRLLASGSSALGDPLLKLLSPGQALLATDDDGAGQKNAEIQFTATSTGTHYLVASGNGGSVGGYALTAVVADRTAPVLTGSTPADKGTGFAVNGNLVLNFSEPVTAGSGSLTLLRADGTVERSIAAGDASQVTINGSTVTINPATDLAPASSYTLTIAAGAFRDLAGNAHAGLAGSSALGFGTAAPQDDFAGDSSTTGSVVVNGAAATGKVEVAGDTDLFKLSLNAGVTYLFDLVSATSGGLADPLLVLYDGQSLLPLLRDNDSGDQAGAARISFLAPTTGSYYLAAADNGRGTGAYRLTAATATDDLPWSTATPASVTVNGAAATGKIEVANDADMFKVTLQAGQTYRFELGAAAGSGLADPYLSLYGAGLQRLAFDDNSGGAGNARIVFTATSSGSYYLSAEDAATGIGSYVLSAATLGDTVAPTLTLLSPADDAVNIGRERDLVLSFSEPVKAGSGNFTLYRSDGTLVATLAATDSQHIHFAGNTVTVDSKLELRASQGYYLNVAAGAVLDQAGNAFAGISGSTRYNFSTAADDYSSAVTSTTTLAVGASVSGQVEVQSDRDAFKIELVAGTRYVFDLAATASGGLGDPYLGLIDPTQAWVTGDDDSGPGDTAARITYTAPTTGTYVLVASDYANGTGGYVLSAARADAVAPTLAGSTPADNATGVAPGANLVLVFSEPVAAGSGSFTLYRANGSVAATIAATDATQVSFAGSTVTLNPAANLDAGGAYYLNIAPGAVVDVAGNPYAGLSGSTALNFAVAGSADDFPYSTATPGVVPTNGTARTGAIESAGDKDLFKIELVAGTTYTLYLGAATSGGVAYPVIDLFDGAMNRLATDTGGGSKALPQASVVYAPTTSGTYYIGASDSSNGTGKYQITAQAVIDDQANDRSTTGVVVVDGAATAGNIQYSLDKDYFKVELYAGTTYAFEMKRDGNTTLLTNLYLGLESAGGERLASVEKAGSGSKSAPAVLTYTPTSNGTYYLAASSGEAMLGAYQLTAKTVVDDYPWSTTTSGSVVVNGAASTGTIGVASDRDLFKVSLVAGKSYRFDLAPGSSNGLKDPYLHLYSPELALLATDDDSGSSGSKNGNNAARITYTAAVTGTYYLGAMDDDTGTGAYTLSAVSFVDTAAPLLVSARPADNATNVARTRNFSFTFNEPVTPGSGNVLVYRNDGSLLTTVPITDSSLITFDDRTVSIDTGYELTPLKGYYLNITPGAIKDLAGNAFAGLAGSTAYNVTIAADDYSAITSTTGLVTVNGASSFGQIEAALDTDLFKVTLSAGVKYQFELKPAPTSGLPAPYLMLLDAQYHTLATDGSASGSKRAQFSYTPTTSGTYYLDAMDYAEGTGGYLVSASTADVTPPQLQGSTPADNATGVARNANLVLNFSENVLFGSGQITLYKADGSIAASISAADGTQVSYAGKTVTINPAADLEAGAGYYLNVAAGAIVDAAGNAWAGLSGSTALNFGVLGVNRNPVGANASASLPEDGALGAKLPAATDPDGNPVSYQLLAQPAHGSVELQPDGSYTYRPEANYSGKDRFDFAVTDGLGGSASYRASITVVDVPDTFTGTEGNDDMRLPYPGRDTYHALGGNDRITPGAGDDTVYGGSGLDTVVFDGLRSDYLVTRSGGVWWATHATQGKDTLSEVERLAFDDLGLALDLDGNAGLAARVVGAVYGVGYLHDPAVVGRLLGQLDAGRSYAQVVADAVADPLFASLAGSRSNTDFVRLVYSNVVGVQPGAADLQDFAGLIDSGVFTQASLAQLAADTELNAQHVDLNGLASTGLAYSG